MSTFARHPYSTPNHPQYDNRPAMSSNNNDPAYRPSPIGNGYSNGHGNGGSHGNSNGNQYPPMHSMPTPSQMNGPPPSNYYSNQPPSASSSSQESHHGNYYGSGQPTSGPPGGPQGGAELATLAPGTQPPADKPEGRSMEVGGRKYE